MFFRSSNVDGRKEEEKHEKDYEKSIKKNRAPAYGRQKEVEAFSLVFTFQDMQVSEMHEMLAI